MEIRVEGSAGNGLETTPEDDPASEAVEHEPFDPSKIRVNTRNVVVDQIVSRSNHGELDLAPDFQRLRVWKPVTRSRLIESLLLRIPIPVFYVAADEDDNWAVVDGLQRLSTIIDFVGNEFPLTKLEYRDDYNGRDFSALPRPMQRRIRETELVVHVIEPGTPEAVMFNIFRRINTGGAPLRAQEIRHALHPGPVRAYLEKLAGSAEFRSATDGSVSPRRMADRECVLRFLAFYLQGWENYGASSLDGYLNETMRRLNQESEGARSRLEGTFRRTMQAALAIFGKDAFRKRYHERHSRYPVNLPLFEAWSVALARLPEEDLRTLEKNALVVKGLFAALLNGNARFEKAVSLSTGSRDRIRTRFRAIDNLVREVLQ